MEILKLSNSKITTWRKCHRAYHYKYVEKLVRKSKGGALRRGSAIHECIEAFHNGKSWRKPFEVFKEDFYKNTFSEERELIGDLPKMVEAIMENYALWIEEDEDELEYITQELEFSIPLMPGVEMIGFLDSLVKKKGRFFPLERKTYAKDPDRDFLVFNTQSAIYSWAATQLGYPASGTLWEIIKAKEPSKPKLTQKGVLSKAKLDSTPHTVRKGLIELGLDPKEHQDFIESFTYDDFFSRQPVVMNKEVVGNIMKDCRSTAREILNQGEKLMDRNLGRDCSFCDYRPLCAAELMGLDYDYIAKHEYTLRKEEDNGKKNRKQDPQQTQKGRK